MKLTQDEFIQIFKDWLKANREDQTDFTSRFRPYYKTKYKEYLNNYPQFTPPYKKVTNDYNIEVESVPSLIMQAEHQKKLNAIKQAIDL